MCPVQWSSGQGSVAPRLKSSIHKLYILVDRCEIPISQKTMDISLFTYKFSFLYHGQDFYRTWLYTWVTQRVSYKKQERLTIREHLCSVLWCPLQFSHKKMFGSSLPPNVYLRYLCLFTYNGVRRILCCVFDLFFFVLRTLCCRILWIVHFSLRCRYLFSFVLFKIT
jgi:hypothetical protein